MPTMFTGTSTTTNGHRTPWWHRDTLRLLETRLQPKCPLLQMFLPVLVIPGPKNLDMFRRHYYAAHLRHTTTMITLTLISNNCSILTQIMIRQRLASSNQAEYELSWTLTGLSKPSIISSLGLGCTCWECLAGHGTWLQLRHDIFLPLFIKLHETLPRRPPASVDIEYYSCQWFPSTNTS